MIPHQRITFSNSHRWMTFNRAGVLFQGKYRKMKRKKLLLNLNDQAKRELQFSLDRPISGDKMIFDDSDDDGKVDWYIIAIRGLTVNGMSPSL